MKTININLLGDLGKTPKKNKIEKIEISDGSKVDQDAKNLSIFLILCATVIFIICLGVWLWLSYSCKSMKKEIIKINKEYQQILPQINDVEKQAKLMKNKKIILELKNLVKNQINNDLLSWFSILTDISKIVPKDLKIIEISQKNKKKTISNTIEVEGQISSDNKNALRLISYFVLNINENLPKSSLLQDSIIKSIKYDENSKIYTFLIEITVQKMKKIEIKPLVIDKTIKSQSKNTESKTTPKVIPKSTSTKNSKVKNNFQKPVAKKAQVSEIKKKTNTVAQKVVQKVNNKKVILPHKIVQSNTALIKNSSTLKEPEILMLNLYSVDVTPIKPKRKRVYGQIKIIP